MPSKIPRSFYQHKDTLWLARHLLGSILCTCIKGEYTSAMIVETEAYLGVVDKASHAFNHRHTPRTSTMYLDGGVAYVYFIYGMHYMFNVVTHAEGTPHAILIRAGQPIEGIETMLCRRNKPHADFSLTRGPGSLAKALGITMEVNGTQLDSQTVWMEKGNVISPDNIVSTPRIGVDYAGEDALLDYRFFIKNNPWVSGSKNQNQIAKTSDS